MTKLRLGFFASHGGSNMQAIIDACQSGHLNAEPCLVFSNNRNSEAVLRAQRQSIPTQYANSKTHPDSDTLDLLILEALKYHRIDLVILAGYMRKIGPRTLRAYSNRILNIHPSLLPKYGGKGMYGIRVHEAVLAAGDTETGVTIHLINENYDEGPILAQCAVPVIPGDTPVTLAERVLAREHEFFVDTIAEIIRGNIRLPVS